MNLADCFNIRVLREGPDWIRVEMKDPELERPLVYDIKVTQKVV
jgi:hypothetical protein